MKKKHINIFCATLCALATINLAFGIFYEVQARSVSYDSIEFCSVFEDDYENSLCSLRVETMSLDIESSEHLLAAMCIIASELLFVAAAFAKKK